MGQFHLKFAESSPNQVGRPWISHVGAGVNLCWCSCQRVGTEGKTLPAIKYQLQELEGSQTAEECWQWRLNKERSRIARVSAHS